jgi:N-acetylated-alpha-linked acidic dipeptidase
MPRPLNRYLHRVVPALFLLVAFFPQAIASRRQSPGIVRGFLPTRVQAERDLEQKFQAIPNPARAESSLRHLSSEPHMAGTEASRRVAAWLRDQYRSFGFEAEIVTYSAWIPLPREVTLDLVPPEKKALASREQPFDGDKDSSDPRAVVAFNSYSPSADVTAAVVYVDYGTEEDYAALDSMGLSVVGKIALVRYGRTYRGVKSKLAEEHKAAGLLIYSDPQDDGYAVGDPYPRGPWRPLTGIQRGSVLYTQIYPGDPLTPGGPATPDASRVAPIDAASLPRIPTLPINAQDAAVILAYLGGEHVPQGWQGGLPLTYHFDQAMRNFTCTSSWTFSSAPSTTSSPNFTAPATTSGSSSATITTRGSSAPPIPAAAPPQCLKPRAHSANSCAPAGNLAARS